MNRRIQITIITILFACFLFVSPAQAAKEYQAENFDVQIDLQQDGSAIVTETVVFRFTGDPFTYVFRDISAGETDGLTFLDASMDGNPMPLGRQVGQVDVQAGDPLKVTWHFPPTANTSHTFVVRYLARGVIRKGAADTLIWRAIPESHDYGIRRSTVTLSYPPEARLLETPALSRDFESTSTAGHITLSHGNLAPDQDIILTAKFAADSLTLSTPHWQVRKSQSDAAFAFGWPIALLTGLATLMLGGLALFIYSRAHRRELDIGLIGTIPAPPSEIPAAIVGRLTGQSHGVMGAIFDLAQRGLLEIREETGFLGSKSYILVRSAQVALLKTFEQGFFEAIFKPAEMEIQLNKVGLRLASNKKLFEEPLDQELLQRGWLDTERKRVRGLLVITGVVMLILSSLVFLAGLMLGGIFLAGASLWIGLIAAIAGICVGLFLFSIPLLIYAGMYSILTSTGEEQSARWKAFGKYLKDVSKGRETAIRSHFFELYLSYAAVFGLGGDWAKYFQKLGGVPLPVWFHAAAGAEANFGAMVAVMSASDTAGSSAGGAGGAGASGGGASGAG